jgi:hypothetical protein
MRHLLHRGYVLRWPDRYTCHGSTACCQYVDAPMCNPPGRVPLWRRLTGRW